MLVFVPTREDVLAIRSIEEAFDLTTTKVRRREVALARTACAERLIRFTEHALDAMADERIAKEAVRGGILYGSARSKDLDERQGRAIGLNFDDVRPLAPRPLRVKVSWEFRYFIPTVHTL